MKLFSYFCLILLCSSTFIYTKKCSVHFRQSRQSRNHKRTDIKKQIQSIDTQLNQFTDQDLVSITTFQQYKNLQIKKLTLLKRQLKTYIDKTSQGYKSCLKNIQYIQTNYSNDTLTMSTLRNNEINFVKQQEQKTLNKLQQIKQKAQKEYESMIIAKLNNSLLKLFNQFNASDTQLDLEQALVIFDMQTIWFATEEKTASLLKKMQSRIEKNHDSIYQEWYKQPKNRRILNNTDQWEKLHQILENIKNNINQLPNKKLIYKDSVENSSNTKFNLIKNAIELELRLHKSANLSQLNQLKNDIKDVINNLKKENAPSEQCVYCIEKLKALKKHIKNEPEGLEDIKHLFEQGTNSDNCIIL